MTTWNQTNLQDPNSPLMEQLMFFHDHTMMILMTLMTIAYIMTMTMTNKMNNRNLLEEESIEMTWMIMPMISLITIALPSLQILYLTDENNAPLLTMKSIGHQWYLSYEYPDFKGIKFDSCMTNNPASKEFRLFEVDNRLIIPLNTPMWMLITASDVIHSWTIPNMGIKIDAIPGRLNQGNMNTIRPGLMFGQCSVICGANHSFMPIVMESITLPQFIKWIKNTH